MWLECRRTLNALACIEAESLKTGHKKSCELYGVLVSATGSWMKRKCWKCRGIAPRVAAMATKGTGWRGNRYRSARCPRLPNQGLSLVNQGLSPAR